MFYPFPIGRNKTRLSDPSFHLCYLLTCPEQAQEGETRSETMANDFQECPTIANVRYKLGSG